MAGETALARRCPLSFPGPFHHGRSPAGGGVGPALRGDRVIQAIEVAAERLGKWPRHSVLPLARRRTASRMRAAGGALPDRSPRPAGSWPSFPGATAFVRPHGDLDSVAGIELAHEAGEVRFDGAEADVQLVGDLVVGPPMGHGDEDLLFPAR